MNEEYKKKYLKYKIKYLELIGGSTDIQGGAEKTSETNIYSIFEILKNEEDLNKIEEQYIKYNADSKKNLVDEIAEALYESFSSDYIEEIGNIKTYIRDKHIDGLFRKEPYKLFMFIVVEFGKLLNCEGTPEMVRMIEILNHDIVPPND